MSEKIKPCPFCGGEVHDYPIEPHKHTFSGMPDHPGSHVIECYACDSGKIGATRDEVIAAWNRRDQSAIEAARKESAAEIADLRRQLAAAQAWKQEAAGCFQAANDEGLQDRLMESGFSYGDGSLADLVARRLISACPPVCDDTAALDALLAAKEREAIEAVAMPEDIPDSVMDATAEAIGSAAYDCTRVWCAWSVGTMGPGDFYSVAEDGDRVAEIARAAITAFVATIRAKLADKSPSPCGKCGQKDHGQTGEYACAGCGLPLVHDDHAPGQERTCSEERPCVNCFSGQGECLGPCKSAATQEGANQR